MSDNNGRCAMRGTCGRTILGKELPCPYTGPAVEPDDRSLLVDVCGEDFAQGSSCCTSDQLRTLRDNSQQAETIISSCPACWNNFKTFFCHFTCAPDQGSFLNVTSTEATPSGETVVKSVDFMVAQTFGEGFYNSCKSVQMGSANLYAMDVIGGGAKNYREFFKFLGDEKPLGSPFQIDFPQSTPPTFESLQLTPRNCSDNDLQSRCACVDCPNVCPQLPYVAPPGQGPTCHVGLISCLSFILILTYGIATLGFFVGYIVEITVRRRREKTYERVALSVETASTSPRSHGRGLVGAGSLAQTMDEDSLTGHSESRQMGNSTSLLNPMDVAQPRQHRLNNFLRRVFYRLGLFAATQPFITFAVVFLVVGLLNIGWKRFEVETDPVRLWVGPSSESKLQKEFFDEHFGPFYRAEQIFVTALPSEEESAGSGNKPPVLTWDHLKYWFKVEEEIRELRSGSRDLSLEDVCFKPAGPNGACVIQSLAAWFENDLGGYDEDSWSEHLVHCASSPVDCLPAYMQPLGPQYVLGGVPRDESGAEQYLDAEAFVVTYVVSDSNNATIQERAMEWEEELKDYFMDLSLRTESEAGLHIAFSTGVSLEAEINKSSNTDIKIVVLSYCAMFLYVSLTLGRGTALKDDDSLVSSTVRWARNFPRLFKRNSIVSSTLSVDSRDNPTIFPRLPRSMFIGSKTMLGLFGILLVMLSVCASVGFFSAVGVKVTLIIAEVIPFLVLAVGVDNVFILVHELDRQNLLHGPNAAAAVSHTVESTTAMSPTNSHRSPFSSTLDDDVDAASMPTYLSAEERVARTLGKMGPSILLSTITETIAFALGAIVPMPAVRNFALYAAGSVFINAVLQITVFVSALLLDLKRMEANRIDCFPCVRLPTRIALLDAPLSASGIGKLAKFIRRYYAPFLLKPLVKGCVLLTFLGILVLSVISIQHTQLGLDQRLALPSDSYLVDYFNNLEAYLDVGPPVYFVSHEVDVTKRDGQQALCGRFSTCQELSVASSLEAERNRSEVSFISQPTASWIDDYLRWLNPIFEDCCRVRKRDPSVFCSRRDRDSLCQPCFKDRELPWNITMNGLPQDKEFMYYLNQWLISPTDKACPLGGAASFGAALSLDEDGSSVSASHFRTFHSPLRTQDDFINSFAAAHRIADDISERTGTQVFPYSLHYVFFDQYSHIIAITQEVLGLGLASVLLVTAILLGSWRTGIIVTICVALTVTTVLGVMAAWGIMLNAISLVNLVISLGIAVEFCAHIARAFMSAGSGLPVDHPAGQRERDERMWTALVDVGPSVLSGITFTKLIGMCVLALTRSRLLEIYYFRMWLTLIISGALHGLILLPVVLSLAGGPGFPQQEADEEWMSNAIRNEYDYAPFLAADDESDVFSE